MSGEDQINLCESPSFILDDLLVVSLRLGAVTYSFQKLAWAKSEYQQ